MPDELTEELYDVVGRYLLKHGWNVVVIGPVQVRQDRPTDSKFKFDFVVRFTGGKIKQDDEPSNP